MRGNLLTLILCFSFFTTGFGQEVLENFEGGALLPWNAADGTFEVVDNPPDQDTLEINPSAQVGSYTKAEGAAFSLLIAQLDNPLDLTTNNQFRIQVNAPVKTSFILKLEGDGEAIEETVPIGVANQWIEYTFNFSEAVTFTTINKIILFFDPGTAESSDTYLFDNLVAEPSGICSGVAEVPTIFDDFECQRNVVYGDPGYTDIEPVSNPDPSGINTSSTVGQYTDREDAFHAFVLAFANGVPIQEGASVFSIKVWAPVTGRLLAKLEGGGSPILERDAQVMETNTWVECKIDFSDQIGADHGRLTLFFNAGEENAAGDIYYIDDLRLEAQPMARVLEDFEDETPNLAWESQGDPGVFGSFDGILDNPDPSEVNNTDQVGSYTKGSSRFGGLEAPLPTDFTLETFPQINIKVWAPSGAAELTMRLFSPSQGLQAVTRPLDATEEWVDLTFNFEDFQTITDFDRLDLLFDQNLETQDTWYFDEVTQGESTVDPCEGVDPIPTVIDNFDCQRNVPIVTGADRLTIVNNPDPSGINPNPLNKVAEYTDPLDQFSAVTWESDQPFDLSLYNQLHAEIWSPDIVPLGFKLDGSATANPIEIVVDAEADAEWVEYVIDFSQAAGMGYTRLSVFFNFAQTPAQEDIYYIDDISWERAPLTGCIANFEVPAFTPTEWNYFANGDTDGEELQVIANPDPSGINTSSMVAAFIEDPTGEIFAGVYADLEAPVTLPADNQTMRIKVWMDHAARVALKLEEPQDGAMASGDVFADYTTPNEWQELTFNYDGSITTGGLYNRVSIIMDFDNTPSELKTYYFDDIVIADASCETTTSRRRLNVERLRVAPNPAFETLFVENAEGIERFVIFNLIGQPVQTIRTAGQANLEIQLADFGRGMYLINGYDEQGVLRASAKIVKD